MKTLNRYLFTSLASQTSPDGQGEEAGVVRW